MVSMLDIPEGYYTVRRDDGLPTVARVEDGENEVEIMGYSPGYTREDVFGAGDFHILCGPWKLPTHE